MKYDYSEYINKKYYHLTILSIEVINKKSIVNYICDCGKFGSAALYSIKKGTTKSCGHLSSEIAQKTHRKDEPQIATLKAIYQRYVKKGSQLSFDEFMIFIKRNCHYCNSPPSNKHNVHTEKHKSSQYSIYNGVFEYNSVDRIDSNKGYEIDNIRPACCICNEMKSNYSIEEFDEWVRLIYENMIAK